MGSWCCWLVPPWFCLIYSYAYLPQPLPSLTLFMEKPLELSCLSQHCQQEWTDVFSKQANKSSPALLNWLNKPILAYTLLYSQSPKLTGWWRSKAVRQTGEGGASVWKLTWVKNLTKQRTRVQWHTIAKHNVCPALHSLQRRSTGTQHFIPPSLWMRTKRLS